MTARAIQEVFPHTCAGWRCAICRWVRDKAWRG